MASKYKMSRPSANDKGARQVGGDHRWGQDQQIQESIEQKTMEERKVGTILPVEREKKRSHGE